MVRLQVKELAVKEVVLEPAVLSLRQLIHIGRRLSHYPKDLTGALHRAIVGSMHFLPSLLRDSLETILKKLLKAEGLGAVQVNTFQGPTQSSQSANHVQAADTVDAHTSGTAVSGGDPSISSGRELMLCVISQYIYIYMHIQISLSRPWEFKAFLWKTDFACVDAKPLLQSSDTRTLSEYLDNTHVHDSICTVVILTL